MLACSKEDSNDIQQEMSQIVKSDSACLGFTMEVSTSNNHDYYRTVDMDSSIIEWRAFSNGEMLFDKEIVWHIENGINKISNIEQNSFDVEYENGDSVRVFNVSSIDSHTTFNITNEEGELVNISVIFDSAINFMDVVSHITPDGSKVIPWPLVYRAAVFVVSAIDTYFAVKCESIVREGVKRCPENHPHCRAKKHLCSVECYSYMADCVCNCVQYSYHG